MRTSIDVLDWFKTKADIDSDYMVSKITGLTTQMLSRVRTGKGEFSDRIILKLLVVGGHDKPLETLAKIESYKAKARGDDEMAKIWNDSVA